MALIVNEEEFIPVKSKSKKRKLDELTEDNGIDMDTTSDSRPRPNLPPISGGVMSDSNPELRKIPVPANRYTPIKDQWRQILVPLTDHLKLKVRFNLRTRNIELATYKETSNTGALQKGADFVKALTLGFEFEDAMALIRLDDLYLETFDVTDVKPLKGDHLSRAVGRIAGKGGKTKFTIENMTKTRIVLANTKVHILGAFQNVRAARRNISSLILGSKSTSVYGHLRVAAKKLGDM